MHHRIFAALIVICFGLSSPAYSEEADWRQLRNLVEAGPLIGGGSKTPMPTEGPVIVTFFASWCPPCTDEFQHLNELAGSSAGQETTIVAINLFEDFGGKKNPARMARFLQRTKPQFPLIEGSETMRLAFGNIERIPTVVVYGTSGREVWRFVHKQGADKTHATKDDLLAALAIAKEN